MSGPLSGWTITGDGVRLHHLEAGSGPAVVLLPGWSLTAQTFSAQLAELSLSRRVVAIDHRGHGRSSTPPAGYHLHRLAADLAAVLSTHNLDDVRLVGHSMGAAVIWSYLELFGTHRLRSVVFVDQMPCALRNPAWNDAQAAEAGATMDAAALFASPTSFGVRGPTRAAASSPRRHRPGCQPSGWPGCPIRSRCSTGGTPPTSSSMSRRTTGARSFRG